MGRCIVLKDLAQLDQLDQFGISMAPRASGRPVVARFKKDAMAGVAASAPEEPDTEQTMHGRDGFTSPIDTQTGKR